MCKPLALPSNLGQPLVPTKVPEQIYPHVVGRGELGLKSQNWLKTGLSLPQSQSSIQ